MFLLLDCSLRTVSIWRIWQRIYSAEALATMDVTLTSAAGAAVPK